MSSIFESIKLFDNFWKEYWSARQLSKMLGYDEYGIFKLVIDRAKNATKSSWYLPEQHFQSLEYNTKTSSWYLITTDDIRLTRYACYMIVQNVDSSKPAVALGQSYFASQVRKNQINNISNDVRRVSLRNEIKKHNQFLAKSAKKAWVEDFASFTDAGYMGLYGWKKWAEIHAVKNLKQWEKILDHMDSEELAANLFRATQTQAKLERENIHWAYKASFVHHQVWKKIRDTIAEIGGTMPEDLPAVEDIKKVEKRLEHLEQKNNLPAEASNSTNNQASKNYDENKIQNIETVKIQENPDKDFQILDIEEK